MTRNQNQGTTKEECLKPSQEYILNQLREKQPLAKLKSLRPRVFFRLPTLGDYFPKDFFDKEYLTFNVINVEEKNETKNVSRQTSK